MSIYCTKSKEHTISLDVDGQKRTKVGSEKFEYLQHVTLTGIKV